MNRKKNGFGHAYGHEADALFTLPDTGIGVAWDYNAGCGFDSDVPNFQPGQATPKQIKTSLSTRITRRRCLLNQNDSSKDDFASFTAQLASLSSLQRKKAVRNPAGASPKCRSPRNPRANHAMLSPLRKESTPSPLRKICKSSPLRKMSTPSPLRKDYFESLLNDSTDNEVMILCSQAAEEECMRAEMKSVINETREGRNGSSLKRASTPRTMASPLSRKRLLSITSPRSPPSLTKATDKAEQAVTRLPHAPSKPDADQCNNNNYNYNAATNFGLGEDDDIFMNLWDGCSKLDQSVPPTKGKSSLSLKNKSNAQDEYTSAKSNPVSVDGATNNAGFLVRDNSTSGPSLRSSRSSTGKSFKGDSGSAGDHMSAGSVDPLEDCDADFDLSPDLLNLLDGNISALNAFPEPLSKDSKGKVVTKQPDPPAGTTKSVMQPNGKPADAVTKQPVVPVQTGKLSIQRNGKPSSASTAAVTRQPVQTSRPSLQHSMKSNSNPAVAVTKQTVVPLQTRNQPVKATSIPPKEPVVRKCTPEEIERKRQEALQKLKRQPLRR